MRPPGGDFRRRIPSKNKCNYCSLECGTNRYKRTALNYGGCFCMHACGGGRLGDPHMHHPPQNRCCSRLLVPDCMRCSCKDVVKTRFAPAAGLPQHVLDDMWVCRKCFVPGVYTLPIYQECEDIVLSGGGCGRSSVGFHMLSCDACAQIMQRVLTRHIQAAGQVSEAEASKVAEPLQHHQADEAPNAAQALAVQHPPRQQQQQQQQYHQEQHQQQQQQHHQQQQQHHQQQQQQQLQQQVTHHLTQAAPATNGHPLYDEFSLAHSRLFDAFADYSRLYQIITTQQTAIVQV